MNMPNLASRNHWRAATRSAGVESGGCAATPRRGDGGAGDRSDERQDHQREHHGWPAGEARVSHAAAMLRAERNTARQACHPSWRGVCCVPFHHPEPLMSPLRTIPLVSWVIVGLLPAGPLVAQKARQAPARPGFTRKTPEPGDPPLRALHWLLVG